MRKSVTVTLHSETVEHLKRIQTAAGIRTRGAAVEALILDTSPPAFAARYPAVRLRLLALADTERGA